MSVTPTVPVSVSVPVTPTKWVRPAQRPGTGPVSGPILATVLAVSLTEAADRLLGALALDAHAGWRRVNYRGRDVSLRGGAAAAGGALVAAIVVAPPNWRVATALVGASAALAGGYDDLVAPATEQRADKGWRGHLRALRSGRVSGGAVKVSVIGLGALLAARRVTPTWSRAVPAAALIASTANLANLLDLRPGRAGKVLLFTSAALLTGPLAPVAAACAGASAAELPRDLEETRMLGDLGANTLGALLGLRLIAGSPRTGAIALAVVTALTAASERVSFSAVIESRPVLRRLDGWGRTSQPPPVPSSR